LNSELSLEAATRGRVTAALLSAKSRGRGGEPLDALRASKTPQGRFVWFLALVLATILTSGCAAVALTAAGVGAAVGVNHTLNGIVYKTFAEPLPKVKRATLTALQQMEIPVETVEKTKQGELIRAKAANRAIEVEFESLTPKTTRMRVVADSDGLIKDSATATEIILQTERALPAT
jgi:hypothetical protein